MAVEWTVEKIAACIPLFGKVKWKLMPGDRCVEKKAADDSKENVEIHLVNNVGGDSNSFMENKVWLLTSDDVESIILDRGFSMSCTVQKEQNTGGIAHKVSLRCWKGSPKDPSVQFEASDSDPHFARLKLLQQVILSE